MSSEVNQAHAAAEQMTPTAYISEHLQNLNNTGGPQTSIIDFSIINLDTIFWASAMGLLAVFILLIAARRATPGVPGRFQCFVEMIVEMAETQSKSIVHGDRSYIAPLALFVFFWIILLNTLDLVPVDWVLGVNHFIESFGVHVPQGWDGVLARALAPQPQARFDALSEFQLALQQPLQARRSQALRRLPLQPARLAVLGLVTLPLLLGLLLSLGG